MNVIGQASLTISLDSNTTVVDVIASWKASGADAPTGTRLAVTGTDPTTIISPPGITSVRLTDLHVRNRIANTATVTATIKQSVTTGGVTSTFEVFSAPLAPGDVLSYDHTRGWQTASQALLGANLLSVYQQIYGDRLLI